MTLERMFKAMGVNGCSGTVLKVRSSRKECSQVNRAFRWIPRYVVYEF
jgi:hypothetical protein